MPQPLYSAFNPLKKAASVTLSQSNQIASFPATNANAASTTLGLFGKNGGRAYFEMTLWRSVAASNQTNVSVVGLAQAGMSLAQALGASGSPSIGLWVDASGVARVQQNGAWLSSYSNAAADKHTVGVGYHVLLGVAYATFYLNGNRLWSGAIPAGTYFPAVSLGGSTTNGGNSAFFNAGQRAWLTAPRELPGWFDLPDAIPEIRLADGNFLSPASDAVPNQFFAGRLPERQAVTIARRIRFAPLGGSLKSSASASLIVDNRDGALDALIAADHKGTPLVLARPGPNGAMDAAVPVASLAIDSVDPQDDAQVRISVRDGAFDLDAPLQKMLIPPCYEAAVANQPWPIALGSPGLVAPPLIDAQAMRYACADTYFTSYRLADKGAAFTSPSGNYDVSLDARSFTLATQPVGVVTVEMNTNGSPTSTFADKWSGAGAPFAGTAGAVPTGWTNQSAPATNAPKLSGTACLLGTALSGDGAATCAMSTSATLASRACAILEVTVADNDLAGAARAWTLTLADTVTAAPVAQRALFVCTRPGTYSAVIVNATAATITPKFVFSSAVPGQSVKLSAARLRTLPDGNTLGGRGPSLKLGRAIAEIMLRAGRDATKWSRADVDAIDAATGYAGIDWYADSPISARDALIQLLDSYTATLFEDAAGVLRFVRLVAPETATITGTLTASEMIGDLVMSGGDAPNLSTQWGYIRNSKIMSETDWVTDFTNVPVSYRLPRQKLWQAVISTAVAVAKRYARALFADPAANCLGAQADVQTEADRVAGILAKPRYDYKCTTAKTGFELGQVWAVTYPRYGLAAGKALMVMGIVENLDDDTRTVEFWG